MKLTKEAKKRYRTAQLDKAKKLYRLLLHIVGGPNLVCKVCGCTEEERPMQLDHVNGKNWRAKDLRLDARVKRYRDELKAGVKFRILCIDCNAKDGRARQMEGRISELRVLGPFAPDVEERDRVRERMHMLDNVLFDGDRELF